MSAAWLNFLLSRRYAVIGAGDPVPCANVPPASVEAGGGPAEAGRASGAQGPALAESSAGDTGPFLILPNNISLLDPLLVYAHFAALNPLVLLHPSQGRGLQLLSGGADTLVLPNVLPDDAPHGVLERAADTLASGRSVLLWPCPGLQGRACREVEGTSSAFALLNLLQQRGQRLPELFLVRSEGLWGSRFSCYHLAEGLPSFFSALCARLPALLLGPFLKRRPVRIVSRRHRLGTKPLNARTLNTMLHTWFDAGHEGAVLVPLLPFGRIRRMPLEHLLVPTQTVSTVDLAPAPPAAAPQGDPQTAALSGPSSGLSSGPSPSISSGSSSGISHGGTQDAAPAPGASPEVSAAAAVHDSIRSHSAESDSSPATDAATSSPLTSSAVSAAQARPVAAPSYSDFAEISSTFGTAIEPEASEGASTVKPAINAPLADIAPAVPRTPPLLPVQHALTRQGSVTDASYAQHFSRRSLLGLAKAIGTLIGPVPATRIGVALPCGAGAMAAYIGILDCTLDNDRVPVLLDPAMSADELAACAQETGISHVLTARQLQGFGLPPDTTPIYLEDISPAQIMRGSALSFMGFAGATEVEAPAAIFCQAGSPFPLSLSHNDLMGNLHNLIEQLTASPLKVHSLSILGCLPQHTPLGLLVNTILPLTCGVPIVTVSSPQNDITLARSAEDYSVNCFTGSPQSLRNLLRKARAQLAFRYIMLSPEPCSEELMALLPKACPHAKVFTADMSGEITILA